MMMIAAVVSLLAAAAPAAGKTAMRAVRIHEFGPADVLKLEPAPRFEPSGGADMLVRVHAAAVNPIDWKIRAGQAFKPPLP